MKKVLGLILAIMMVLSSTAYAAEYFFADMESSHGAGMTNDGTPVNFARELVTEADGNSVVRIYQNRTDGSENVIQTRWQKSGTTMQKGQKAFFMLDFKLVRENEGQVSFVRNTAKEGYVIFEFMTGGGTRTVFNLLDVNAVPNANPARSILILPKVNTWYTYLFIYDENFQGWELYRKERDVVGEFIKLFGGTAPNNTTGHSDASIRFYNNKSVEYRVDNVHAWQGSYGRDGSFKIGTEAINTIEQVTSGTLSASIDVVNANYQAAINAAGTALRRIAIQPLMVVYDKNGYMIDCVQPASVSAQIGRNTVSMEADTSGFYDKIEDGYIGYYVFDNMTNLEPLAEPMELN